jgi:hypothetical protein
MRPKVRMSWSCCSSAAPVDRPLSTRKACWIFRRTEKESTLDEGVLTATGGRAGSVAEDEIGDGAVRVVEDGDLFVEVVGALDVGGKDKGFCRDRRRLEKCAYPAQIGDDQSGGCGRQGGLRRGGGAAERDDSGRALVRVRVIPVGPGWGPGQALAVLGLGQYRERAGQQRDGQQPEERDCGGSGNRPEVMEHKDFFVMVTRNERCGVF